VANKRKTKTAFAYKHQQYQNLMKNNVRTTKVPTSSSPAIDAYPGK
jgi:hypothetical protein